MRNLQLSWLFLLILLANCFGIDVVLVSGQCQGDQQSLLLQIRNNLVFNSTLSVNLSGWSRGTDCCNWGGVDCDEAGHVVGLNLSNESISDGIENATGLFSLQYLQSLNLAFNKFNATIPSRLANLKNLTHLNLSNAGFGGQIPIEMSRMTRLVTLDLSAFPLLVTFLPKLENPNLSMLVQNLTELRELYLDGVKISAPGNEWCKALSSSLPNLQILSMSNCFLSGPIDSSLSNLWSLSVIRLDQNNLSSQVPYILADFVNLTSLHLSNCGLQGTFPEKIFQVSKLETLDLSNNKLLHGSLPRLPQHASLRTLMLHDTSFSGSVPDSIANLKNLSRLELENCNFTGRIPTSMANLTQLVYLDLSFNNFTGPIPSFLMSKSLTYLDLSHNLLTGGIRSTNWEQLSNLVYVDLRFNLLNGSIPTSLFSHPSLQQLQLANNQFGGQLLEFSNLSSSVLETLDLSGNRLEGPIPKSIFELKDLKILLLPSNKFNGSVQLNKIQKLSNLTRLDLSYNNLTVNASTSSSLLPQLTTLKLASCKLKVIPNLQNQSRLFHLDLSDNQISQEIPNWIWKVGKGNLIHLNLSHNLFEGLQEPYSVTELSILDLHSNQLHGEIPKLPPNAVYLDYSSNYFSSSLPVEIGNFLSSAVFFSLSENGLTGVIPTSICNATVLQVLDLSSNNLSGSIPRCLIEMSKTLGVLNLRRNNLNSIIPDTFMGNCKLQTLDLNGNILKGMIPKSLANCTMLEVLDLGHNLFSDIFPCHLKHVSTLRVLVLRFNKFYGRIGCPETNGYWQRLQIVDLAFNNFNGSLPGKCLKTWKAMMVDEDEAQSNFKHLRFEFLRLNTFYYQDAITVTSKGLEMELVKILSVFTSIDFSGNNFQGPIPKEMGLLTSLYVLNLSRNALTGQIPSSIGQLRQLESLDLSMNSLSGKIPTELASLTFLSFLNLSYNHFVGQIPSSTQLQSFENTSFEGNDGLCGAPLTNSCKVLRPLEPSAAASTNEFDWQFIAIGVGFGIGSAAVVAPLMFCNKVNEWYDDGIDKFLMVILPMVGLTYITSRERRVEAEENLEDEITDVDDDDEEMETENFHGRYCVFCSKLDITRKRVVHDPKCTCHHSPPISSSSSTSSSSSSLAI